MMKKIVIFSSSLRTQSTSRILAGEVMKGLKESNEVEWIDFNKMTIQFCKGCLACQSSGKCVIKDDVNQVIDTVKNADVLIFATPVYYYSISGQLKTFLDRLNPLFVAEDRKFKEVYAIFTCADTDISASTGPQKAIQGWVDCFYGVKYITSFNGLGISNTSSLTDEIKNKAYKFGKNIGGEKHEV